MDVLGLAYIGSTHVRPNRGPFLKGFVRKEKENIREKHEKLEEESQAKL